MVHGTVFLQKRKRNLLRGLPGCAGMQTGQDIRNVPDGAGGKLHCVRLQKSNRLENPFKDYTSAWENDERRRLWEQRTKNL